MPWLIGFLIVGLLIGLVSLVRRAGDESDPFEVTRSVTKSSHTTAHETGGGQVEYKQTDRAEYIERVGSGETRTEVIGESTGSLLGGIQQRYDSHATYSDGREQWGSTKDHTTYNLHVKEADGTEQDVEGQFPYR